MFRLNPKILLLLVCLAFRAKGQSPTAQMIKGGIDDGIVVLGAYLQPILQGFSNSFNQQWSYTAGTLPFKRFSVSIDGGLFIVPESKKSFNANELVLKNTRVAASNKSSISPTYFGSTQAGPLMEVVYKSNLGADIAVSSYNLPAGYSYDVFPTLPSLQINAGLPFNTEVMLRLVPNISVRGFNSDVFGAGLKHNIMPWVNKQKQPFDLALICGYQYLHSQINSNENEIVYPDNENIPNAKPKSYYQNQRSEMKLNAFMLGIMASKKIHWFEPAAGIIQNITNASFGILGNYPVHVYDPTTNPFGPTIQNVSDPVRITHAQSQTQWFVSASVVTRYVVSKLQFTHAMFNNVSLSLGVFINKKHK